MHQDLRQFNHFENHPFTQIQFLTVKLAVPIVGLQL